MRRVPDPLAKRIGARIRRRRLDLGWTQATVATHLRTSAEYVGMLELGTRLPSLPTLLRISRALGMSLDALVAERRQGPQETLDFAVSRLPAELRPHAARMLEALARGDEPG